MYYCSGFQGQMVAIIPSLDLVIVRMGLKEDPNFNFNGMLSGIVGSFEKKLITKNTKQKPQKAQSLVKNFVPFA